MRDTRLVQLSFVICAAALALNGYGITLMSLSQPGASPQAATPITAIAADVEANRSNSSSAKHTGLSIRRWTRRTR
jgi:hypothetical protein